MIENDLISIVVPVYNVKEYLEESINSVIGQTYTNLEIILVDDGSTDGCSRVCDEYAKIDKRIIVIHKENGGLSDARNKGIDIATGDYLFFIDSDDVLQKNTIELLYRVLDGKKDIISFCGWEKFEHIYGDSQDEVIKHFTAEQFLLSVTKLRNNLIAWGALTPRLFWDNIRFPKGRNFEDMATMFKLYAQANEVISIDAKLYKYRVRSGSIVKTPKKSNADNYLQSANEFVYFLKEKTEIDEKDYNTFLLHSYYAASLIYYDDEYIKKIIEMRKQPFSLGGFTLKNKVKTLLIVFCPKLMINFRRKKKYNGKKK